MMAEPDRRRRTILAAAAGGAALLGGTGAGARPFGAVLQELRDLPRDGALPALFIGHGTPMNALEDNPWTAAWAELGATLPTPRAILCISAHWLTRGAALITASAAPAMNYDMYGFPEALYRQLYPAPGAPDLAREVAAALAARLAVYGDTQWGFDHGTWVVLARMFPRADIPVIQLSIDYSRPPQFHFELGRTLRALRDRGVLIVGSGNLVHNLRERHSPDGQPFDWALEFDARIAGAIEQRDFQYVADFQQLGRLAALAHPSYDHFLPLLYVLGLAGPNERIDSFAEGFQMPAASMRSFLLTPA